MPSPARQASAEMPPTTRRRHRRARGVAARRKCRGLFSLGSASPRLILPEHYDAAAARLERRVVRPMGRGPEGTLAKPSSALYGGRVPLRSAEARRGERRSGPPRAALPDRIAVLGGSSELAEATVLQFLGRRQAAVALLGRSSERLAAVARRLERAGALGVEALSFEAGEPGSAAAAIDQAAGVLGGLDLVLVAVGSLGPVLEDPTDPEAVRQAIVTNAVAACEGGAQAARTLLAEGAGSLVLLSSLAALRPRGANLAYGAAKAAADAYFRGLASVLEPSGIFVMVVRPGFVRGRMTAGRPEMPFAVEPDDVGRAVLAGFERARRVVTVPGVLGVLAPVVNLVPEERWRALASGRFGLARKPADVATGR
jgi:decaprenylphospho-beta-D-erythro-pentofuranosid-2-ulose 2-reductase